MNGLPKPAYILSEPHLSGHRVILGYEALTDAQNAHAMLAAAPAVQPAAGREALALLTELLDGPSQGGFHGINDALRGKLETIRQTLQRAALAHPPAQGSESGGEALTLLLKEAVGLLGMSRGALAKDSHWHHLIDAFLSKVKERGHD